MEKTERLFDKDAYIKEFTSTVLSCEEKNDIFHIVLDKTAFFPEGGGQFADIGAIGSAMVTDVHEKDGIIYHYSKTPLSVGENVSCKINFERRFDFMQQHSGEHIFSGLAHKHFGATNVGFHLGEDITTIDFDVPISLDNLIDLEKKANEAIWKNIPIEITYPTENELRAIPYRSKKELFGDIRIVTIPGYDICACCGTHVSHTGEIGIIKVVDTQNYKGGTRLWILCGGRALKDYDAKNASINNLSTHLSVKPLEVNTALSRIEEELTETKLHLSKFENAYYLEKSKALGSGNFIYTFEEGLSPDSLRRFALILAESFESAVVFSKGEEDYKYAIASETMDIRPLTKKLNDALGGRGGGKSSLTGGSCKASKEEIEKFFTDNM